MDRARLFLLGPGTLIGFLLLAALATPTDAAVITLDITVDQILIEADGNNYSNLSATVLMEYNDVNHVLTVTLTNTSGPTSGPTATNDAGNLLTGLGFNLPSGTEILDTGALNSSVSYNGSTLINTSSFTEHDWGYSNSASGHLLDVPGVLSVDTTLSSLAADASVTFAGGKKSRLDGVDYGLKSAEGNAGPSGQAAIEDHVVFTLYLSANDESDLLKFIEKNPVVASFGSPDIPQVPQVHTPEPASFIVWFLIGLTWAGSAWTHQYRRRWRKWQQEEALAADGNPAEDRVDRFAGGGDDVGGRVALPTLSQFPGGAEGPSAGG